MIKTIKNKYKKYVVNPRMYSLNIIIMAMVFLIFVFFRAASYLYVQSPSSINYNYRQELEEYFSQENAKREWKGLHKYHGYPQVVIYEEGKTPYFYDKQGSKCAFIYPSKGAGLISK